MREIHTRIIGKGVEGSAISPRSVTIEGRVWNRETKEYETEWISLPAIEADFHADALTVPTATVVVRPREFHVQAVAELIEMKMEEVAP